MKKIVSVTVVAAMALTASFADATTSHHAPKHHAPKYHYVKHHYIPKHHIAMHHYPHHMMKSPMHHHMMKPPMHHHVHVGMHHMKPPVTPPTKPPVTPTPPQQQTQGPPRPHHSNVAGPVVMGCAAGAVIGVMTTAGVVGYQEKRQATIAEAGMGLGFGCPALLPWTLITQMLCRDNDATYEVARLAWLAEKRRVGDGSNPIFVNAYYYACRGQRDPGMLAYARKAGLLSQSQPVLHDK